MPERDRKGKFLPGHKKLGGAKKGSKYLANDLYPYLKEQGVDPKELLVEHLRSGKVTVNELIKILDFCYAKKKPIPITVKDREELTDEVGDYTYLLGNNEDTNA